MKRVFWNHKKEKGFTLLEIIVTILVAAIIGSMLIPLMGTALKHSADPAINVQDEFQLNKVMENITADYKNLINGLYPLTILTARVGDENTDQDNSYGQYNVVKNCSITFTGTPLTEQQVGLKKIQKITISYKGYTLTSLFTE